MHRRVVVKVAAMPNFASSSEELVSESGLKNSCHSVIRGCHRHVLRREAGVRYPRQVPDVARLCSDSCITSTMKGILNVEVGLDEEGKFWSVIGNRIFVENASAQVSTGRSKVRQGAHTHR